MGEALFSFGNSRSNIVLKKDLNKLKDNWPQIIWKVRIGTDLWLGDRGALKAKAQLLEISLLIR